MRPPSRAAASLLILLLGPAAGLAQDLPAPRPLPDGVVHWKAPGANTQKTLFFQLFERLSRALLPASFQPPFERSVAFLAGVSTYSHLSPQLPFVANDLRDMREYLLREGGFDEVYVAADGLVSQELIEHYMMNHFPSMLGPRDRLLFYYAGHGADARATTGYLQFANARQGDFARGVLAIDRVLEWSRVSRAGHMLFLLDTCSSGLAFTPRSGLPSDTDERGLIGTLSGGGSRAVITAGTAEEQTFEIRTGAGGGNGVFTRALLTALREGRSRSDAPAFLTIEQVLADTKIQVGRFASRYGKELHPRLWTFDEQSYRGSFVFLNPGVRSAPLRPSHRDLLAVGATTPRRAQETPPPSLPQEHEGRGTQIEEPDLGQFRAHPPVAKGGTTDTAPPPPSPKRRETRPAMMLEGLKKTGSSLRGRIVDQAGAGLPGVAVTLTPKDRASKVSITNAKGNFSIPASQPGAHELLVELEGFTRLRFELRIQGGSVRITLSELPDSYFPP